MKFKGIIFDIDGTITSTNELIFASFNHITEKYLGRKYSPEEQKNRVQKIIKAPSFIEDMIKLSGFFQIENYLKKYNHILLLHLK